MMTMDILDSEIRHILNNEPDNGILNEYALACKFYCKMTGRSLKDAINYVNAFKEV